jgi:hypothetical protein
MATAACRSAPRTGRGTSRPKGLLILDAEPACGSATIDAVGRGVLCGPGAVGGWASNPLQGKPSPDDQFGSQVSTKQNACERVLFPGPLPARPGMARIGEALGRGRGRPGHSTDRTHNRASAGMTVKPPRSLRPFRVTAEHVRNLNLTQAHVAEPCGSRSTGIELRHGEDQPHPKRRCQWLASRFQPGQ